MSLCTNACMAIAGWSPNVRERIVDHRTSSTSRSRPCCCRRLGIVAASLLIGDAAHTTTPHHAQGAAMAVEDAVVLCRAAGEDGDFTVCSNSSWRGVGTRCKLVVEASVQVGDWELNPTPTSITDAITLGNHVRATLAHAF